MKVRIEGMTCDRCVRRVATAIRSVAGVTRVDVDPVGGVADVDGTADFTRVALAVSASGYRATREGPPANDA